MFMIPSNTFRTTTYYFLVNTIKCLAKIANNIHRTFACANQVNNPYINGEHSIDCTFWQPKTLLIISNNIICRGNNCKPQLWKRFEKTDDAGDIYYEFRTLRSQIKINTDADTILFNILSRIWDRIEIDFVVSKLQK